MNKCKNGNQKISNHKKFSDGPGDKKKKSQNENKTKKKENEPALRTRRFSNVQMNQTRCIRAAVHEVG